MLQSMLYVAGATLLSACAVLADGPVEGGSGATPAEVALAFVAAYNDHDVEGMLALAAPDITWLSVEGDGIEVVARGTDALRESLGGYFEEFPDARSEIDATMSNGAFVATRERASWREEEGVRVQSALAIYEICGARVCRVWYYPALYQ